MAAVPGITPFQLDSPDAGGQQPQRLQISEGAIPSPEPLRPVATPTDTFKRFASFSDPTLQRVADSLGQLAPGIYRYGDIQQQAEQNKTAQDQMYAKLAGRTPDEQGAIIQSDPMFQNHFGKQFGNALMGKTIGEQAATAAAQSYQTSFDKVNGDFNAWANQTMQTTLAGINDPVAKANAARRLETTIDALRQQQGQFGVQQQQTDQNQLMQGGFNSIIGQAIDSGATPEQAFAAIQQQKQTTNTVYARMTPQQQNAAFLTAIQQRAETLPYAPNYSKSWDMIKGLLQAPFTDASGQTHSLLEDATLGAQAHRVFADAMSSFTKRDMQAHSAETAKVQLAAIQGDPIYPQLRQQLVEQHPQWEAAHGLERWDVEFGRAQIRAAAATNQTIFNNSEQATKSGIVDSTGVAALQQGQAYSVADVPYRVTDPRTGQAFVDPKDPSKVYDNVYSAKDIIKDATDRLQDQIDRQYAQDPQGRFNAMAQLYGSNGLVNKQWETTLKSGAAAAGIEEGATGRFKPATVDGLNLYRQLQAQNPHLLAAHTDKPSQDFYNAASTAMDNLGLDQTQALQLAQRATSDPNFGKAMPDMQRRETMQTVKSQLGTMLKFPGSYDLSNVNNSDEVAAKVVESADLVRRATGVPMDTAVKQVAPQVAANYQIVNGNAINVEGREVPQNFGALATRYVQDFAGQNKAYLDEHGIDPSQLTITNVAQGGNWAIYANGRPIRSTVPGSNFTVANLNATAQTMKAEHDTEERTKQERHLEPWFNTGDPSKGAVPVWGLSGPMIKAPQQIEQANQAAQTKYDRDQKAQQEFDAQHRGDPTQGRVIPGL